jgi:hypothetical protein
MIDADIARDHPHLARLFRPGQPEAPVTGPDPLAPAFAKTAWQSAHEAARYAEQVLGGALRAVGHIAQLGEHAITDPVVDDCLETVLRAYHRGVDAPAFQAAAAVLRDAMERKGAGTPPGPGGAAPVAAADDTGVVPDHPDAPEPPEAVSAPQAPADGEPAVPPAGPSAVQPASDAK